jgi:phosphoribosyl 1,2-cyclic phosphodiesterase
MTAMAIRFWGVRGSIASPGPRTAGVGGNTSCVEVTTPDGDVLVLDAGTGIRALGDELVGRKVGQAYLLLSHLHWDHIQGLPFFLPAWLPSCRLDVVGAVSTSTPELSLKQSLEQQMQPPHFPVRLSDMGSHLAFRQIESGQVVKLGGATVTCKRLNHPGGVTGYRIEAGGRAIVYATDTEHYGCPDPHLVALARGADVLVYDAMYTEDEYAGRKGPSKVGWGHSTWEAGCAVADAAGVDRLVLFHHDPSRSDAEVEAIERDASIRRPGTVAAREGLEVILPARVVAKAA